MSQESKTCPYAHWHGPEGKVIVGETSVGQFKDEKDGKVKNMSRSTDRTIRYGDWEFRCRVCYPRI